MKDLTDKIKKIDTESKVLTDKQENIRANIKEIEDRETLFRLLSKLPRDKSRTVVETIKDDYGIGGEDALL